MAGFRGRRPVRPEPGPEINGRLLKHRELRVIGEEGEQLGVLTSKEALDRARSQGMDLILVAGHAQPPVAKIADYGKHKYLEGKLGKDKKKQTQELKGIKLSPRIADHDMEHLIKNAIKFFEQGHKVKVTCMFRMRELAHPENGKKRLDKFAEACAEYGIVERTPSLDGRQMIMVMLPKPAVKKKEDAKDQNEQDGSEEV